jgi:hypothetical protein
MDGMASWLSALEGRWDNGNKHPAFHGWKIPLMAGADPFIIAVSAY